MKKLITLLLVIITAFILTTGVSAKTVIKGDLNLDNNITAADARGTLRISAKLDTADETQLLIADVTNDKQITASDARSILRFAAKLETSFGEIEIGGNTQDETTTSASKSELSSNIGQDFSSVLNDIDNLQKVETSDGRNEYTNDKITITSDPSIINDGKISGIIIHDSGYSINGVSVDMSPDMATSILKDSNWIVNTQTPGEISLIQNLMKIIIHIEDGKITSIEYVFSESLLHPDEITTKAPVAETTTISGTPEITTESTTKENHKHDYKTEVKAPTCTEKGFTTYKCACGDKYVSDETPAKGHDYVSVITAPTCSENGFTKNTCSVCGDLTITDTVAATGHNAAWVSVKKPAPGVEGLDHFKCRICSAVLKEEIISALPLPEKTTAETTTEEPTTQEPVTEEPTSEAPPVEETTTQAPPIEEPTTEVEEPTTNEPVSSDHEHVYELTTVVPPACDKDGYTRFTCTVCGNIYDTDIITSTGHSAVWVCITPAEIGKDGLEQFKCKNCDAVLIEQVIPALKAEEQEKPEGDITVDDLPYQIKVFMGGTFGIEGYNYSEGTKNPISMYLSADHIKAGMNLDGMPIDMLIRDVQKKNSKVYLIKPDEKKYAELSTIVMNMLGLKPDDLKIDFSGTQTTPDSIIHSTQSISGEKYDIYSLYTGEEYCKIYMLGEEIKRIETYETSSKMLKTRIDVTTFIEDLPADTFSLDGYKKVMFTSLFGSLSI